MGGWSREGPGCLSPAASLCPSVATAPAGPILPRSCSHGLGERGPAPNLVPYSFGGSGGGGDRFLLLPAAGLPAGSVPHSVLTHLGLLQACITLAPTPPPPGQTRSQKSPAASNGVVLLPKSFASALCSFLFSRMDPLPLSATKEGEESFWRLRAVFEYCMIIRLGTSLEAGSQRRL